LGKIKIHSNNLLLDYYELTMCYSYFINKKHHEQCVFDVFFREIPYSGGYAIFCGLEDIVNYVTNLKFSIEEINFLRGRYQFSSDFLEYLAKWRFKGDIYSFKEGSVIFPNEPIIIVKGNLFDCQIIETYLLTIFNHQSLIATKASRIVNAAIGRGVMEFGARRAHGSEAAIKGARAAYICGVIGTSNVIGDYLYNIPALGTMAHSYVMTFDSEYEAFKHYALSYPNNTTLLVDTYNTLKSGVPNAIKIHNEVLKPLGYSLKGIRIDSGDLAYLSTKARQLLDSAGLFDTKITVSNSLDEYLITSLISEGAKIDAFGVGEKLITGGGQSIFGGVYKITAREINKILVPTIKLSDNPSKTTLPGFKKVYRFYDLDHKAIADLICLNDEQIDHTKPYLLFDPVYTYKQKEVINYKIELKTIKIIEKGKVIIDLPTITQIKEHCQNELNSMWSEIKRLYNPHNYYVDLSNPLYELLQSMINKLRV